MKYSIIIPSYNELNDIKFCIESCLELNFDNYEIIIVDKSFDGTFEFLEITYKNKVQLIKQSGNGLNNAYNKGIQNSNGDIIVLLTADNILPVDYLKFLQNNFINNEIDSVIVNSIAKNITDHYSNVMQNLHDYKYHFLKLIPKWGEGFSFRRKSMSNYFIENEIIGGTDNMFAEQFANTLFCRDYYIEHIIPSKFNEIIKQNINRGKAVYTLKKMNLNKFSALFLTSISSLYRLIISIFMLNVCSYLYKVKKLNRNFNFKQLLYITIMDLSIAYGCIIGIFQNKNKWK